MLCTRIVSLLLMLMAWGGCSSTAHPVPDKPYATLQKDPTRDTDTARALCASAVALIDEGKFAEAEPVLKQALESDVLYGPAHSNLGWVYYQRGDYYQAAWEFQYAAKLMPYQPEPRNNLGLVMEETGKLNEAIDNYDRALALQPDNPELLANSARARLRRGDRDRRVVELLEQLVSVDHRPKWRDWANEQLVLQRSRHSPATTQP